MVSMGLASTQECGDGGVQFKVSTEGLAFLVSDAPVQRLDYETKALKTTEDGRPVYGGDAAGDGR
jgi:hypothetical protein